MWSWVELYQSKTSAGREWGIEHGPDFRTKLEIVTLKLQLSSNINFIFDSVCE